jgi:hypothetical protein
VVNPRFAAGAALAVVVLSCRGRDRVEISPEFVVPSLARDLTFPKAESGRAVRFNLNTPYPATEYLQQVRDRLTATGWQPLERHWLETKYESSHVRGWTYFQNTAVRGVHQWLASWQNKPGDVVTYQLEYASPLSGPHDSPSKPRNDELVVVAFTVPSAVVAAMRENVRSNAGRNSP